MPAFEIAKILAFSLLIAVNTWAQAAQARAQIVQAVDPGNLAVLRGNTPRLARAENDRGAAPDGLPLNRMLLVLKRSPQQEAALHELLVEQQVKSSPDYHRWLTPAQFGEQFGPADADIQALSDWLRSQGFEVEKATSGRSVIEFSGSAGLVREVFHTGIHQFVVHGRTYWSNARDPQIPAALIPVVAGIASLNNFPIEPMSRRLSFPVRVNRARGATSLYTITGPDGTVYHALSPADFDTIYNVPPSVGGAGDGLGQTIAIVAASNINMQDWDNFREAFALAGPNPNIILNGPDPGIIPGYESEADIDMEWAGAIAQFATIDLVVSEDTLSTPGISLSALYTVDNNLAPVLSVSYGYCEASLGAAGNAFFNSLWEQAAAEGISVVVATGDTGSAVCDAGDTGPFVQQGLAVSGVASTPFDLAVGGTDFNDSSDTSQYWNSTNNPTQNSSALSYIPEITWNDSCAQAGSETPCNSIPGEPDGALAGGGGGPSTCSILTSSGTSAGCAKGYPKPAWQTGPGVPADAFRDIPDISLFSGEGRSGSFYLFCEADANLDQSTNCSLTDGSEFEAAGGTSFSAQTFAAIMALVDQKTGERQGDPDYVLYSLAAQTGASCPADASAIHNSSCIFHDVVTGNNSLPCESKSPDCGPAAENGVPVLTKPGSTPAVPAWTAGPGYDLATGLGSVNVTNLINKWSSVSFTPSTTQLTLSPTTLTHGQAVTVSVQVTAQGGTPTGTIALLGGPNGTDPGPGIASFTLSGGAVSGSTTSLPGGAYSVTAHYAGDGTYGASDSNPVQVTVSKENSATTLGIVAFDSVGDVVNTNTSTFAYGSPYILSVEVENAAGISCGANQVPATACPSGTVNLTDNGAPLDSTVSTLNSLGEMQDNPIQLLPGSHTLVASYLGDGSFNASTSNPDVVTVTQAATMSSLSTSSSSVQAGNSVTLMDTVTSQSSGAAPTGTVQFLNGSTPISGTVTYSPASPPSTPYAQLTASLTTVLPATAAITAVYSGDSNYAGSKAGPLTVTVALGFGLSVSPASIAIAAPGQSGTATLKVASGGGFSGTVTFGCQLPPNMTGAACSFSPPSLTTSGKSTLTITTTASQNAAALFNWYSPSNYILAGIALFSLALIVLSGFLLRRRRLWYAFGISVSLAFLLAVATAGCGGGSQGSGPGPSPPDPGTPAGTYAVTITATSGTTAHQTILTVTIP